jgi:hypothetical protein
VSSTDGTSGRPTLDAWEQRELRKAELRRNRATSDLQPDTQPLFAPEANLIELFVSLLGDKELDVVRSGDGVALVVVPPPTRYNALAQELLASVQPVLIAAWYGALQRPQTPSTGLWTHPCGDWSLMTTARSKSACKCGDKTPRTKINVPWHTANRHGRPVHPNLRKKESSK